MSIVSPADRGWTSRTEPAVVWAIGLAGLAALGFLWLPALSSSHVAPDYAFYLPSLLAGADWHAGNPWFALPWFTPAQCGGFPLHADPQGLYLSLPQLLTWLVGPLQAVRASFLVYAAAGYAGACWLARSAFGTGLPAAVLAGLLFMLNGFYAVRMTVGHLGFEPFMLLPAMAACLLANTSRMVWPCCVFALGLTAMLEGGMAALLAPCMLSLVIIVAMHSMITRAPVTRPVLRLVGGSVAGAAIGAGKLAGMVSLLAHLPRDAYRLPGYDSLGRAAWVAVRTVFIAPWPDMQTMSASEVRVFLHELDYGVGPMPLLLMLAAAFVLLRQRARPARRTVLLAAALALLLLVPVAFNTAGPAWSAFLKTLPILRNSSLALRWFAAYILPATMGGAVALDWLARLQGRTGWLLSAASAAGTLAALVFTVGAGLGSTGFGSYDPTPVQLGWSRLRAGAPPPPITHIDRQRLADGADDLLTPSRQDAFLAGGSQMNCYQPLFGYALEWFPRAGLHPGSILDVRDGHLNIKNPACYLFPAANDCRPGDAFGVEQEAAARSFAAYRAFPWSQPGWARAANWLGIAAFLGTAAALAGAATRQVRA